MPDEITVPLGGLLRGMDVVALAALLVGLLSAAAPPRSIALYQWIMARCNWRVSPIDQAREVRTTRLLGVLLILLGMAVGWLRVVR